MEKKLRNIFRTTQGVDLFKDALAYKVRDEFRAFIALGFSVQEAEDMLINFFENAVGEECDRGVCYLALAVTEWNAGRLTERLKQKP